MKTFLVLTIVQLISNISSAYILPLDTILNKTCAHAGNTIISVEQDVIFKEYNREFSVHENWLIEGDKNLKLTATGNGELKDLIRLTYIYNNDRMTQVNGKNRISTKISRDFFERFLAIKSRDSYMTYLNDMGIATKVRLSRAGGSICFAIGQASTERALSPQFWIDQEFFQLRKIRLPSEADIEFNNYEEFGKVHYPILKKVSWADKSVTIRVLNVSTKTGASIRDFYPETLTTPSELLVSNKATLGSSIEEFYKRFR
jgi:hypothetical protein